MRSILFAVSFFLATGIAGAQSSSASGKTAPTATTASTVPAPPVEAAPESVPVFVFRSLDDASAFISSASLAGTVYLVDFWATWCPPCVEALPDLEKIHEEFHPRGFEIVSLSFDASDERVAQFRAKRFRMPWKHGRLEGGFGDIVAIAFALQNIPHYVLVGRDGRILAEGDDLHGQRLRDLLASALEE